MDYSTTHTGQRKFRVEIVEYSIQVWDADEISTIITLTPESRQEVKLFAHCYFLQEGHKYEVHFCVMPKPPMDFLSSEEHLIEEVTDTN